MIRSTTVVGTLDISIVFVVTVIVVDSSKYMHKIHAHTLTSTPIVVTPPSILAFVVIRVVTLKMPVKRQLPVYFSVSTTISRFFFVFLSETCVCKRYHPFYSIQNFASTWLPLTLACAFAVISMFEKHFVCIAFE